MIKTSKQLRMTLDCLNSIKRTDLAYELIVVETVSDYLRDFADVHIWEREKTSCTRSINRAFSACRSDYVALVTNDVVLEDNWLERLLQPFKKHSDCGLSTLATSQLGHVRKDEISEGVWFSVAMIPSKKALFDENYVNSWDDTDLVMRTYLEGKKMYRNYNSIVEHHVGATEYLKEDHKTNFEKNRLYFEKKFKDFKDHRMYKILTEGLII